jgi:hypothetical protein
MRVVLDTNILVSALIAPAGTRHCTDVNAAPINYRGGSTQTSLCLRRSISFCGSNLA